MALAQPTPLPFPEAETITNTVQPASQDLIVEFAGQFSALQGKFVFCLDEKEVRENLQKLCYQNGWTKIYCAEKEWEGLTEPDNRHTDIATCDAAITSCETLVARTGSIVLSAVQQGRLPSVYAPVHVCIAYASQLVYDVKDSLLAIKKKYPDQLPSLITFATGPSRTADIEKTLVVGVHGPKEVYCFVVDDTEEPRNR